MRFVLIALASVLLVAVGAAPSRAETLEAECRVIEQPTAPLSLSDYSCAYVEGGRTGRDGIRHSVKYQNRSGKKIVAVKIGIVSFDAFNEFIGKLGGVDLDDVDVDEISAGVWMQSRLADFAFHTGVAYVASVRFADGTIWAADSKQVLSFMNKIQADFDAANLKSAKPPSE
jgi:hypothetical protein